MDLLVIGGGINGLGIAADAAARGLSVVLAERGDFGGATTSASSRLIHGGLRYLQYGELRLVAESLRERGILLRQRPHLVRPLRLLVPAYQGLPPAGWKVGLGLRTYDLLARDPAFPPSEHLPLAETLAREPGLEREGLTGGHVYSDGQIEFPERLCVELAREIAAAGGQALNYSRVAGLRTTGGRVTGAVLRDSLTGAEREIETRLVINAAGPWVDVVNALLPKPPQRLVGGTWGSHVALPSRPDGPRGALYTAARKDGRPIFFLPWDERLLVGTTDVPFTGNPDELRVQSWEVEYLLGEVNRLFPGCGYDEGDVQLTTIGIRPLPASRRRAAAITRRHFVVDHAGDGAAGLASIVGGKLTTYRSLAEDAVDWALKALGRAHLPSPTRAIGSHEGVEAAALAAGRELGLAENVAQRLFRLYGGAVPEVLEPARRERSLAAELAPGSRAIGAEVVHAVRVERARTVDDVLRRRLMLLPASDEIREAVRRVAAEHSLPLAAREPRTDVDRAVG